MSKTNKKVDTISYQIGAHEQFYDGEGNTIPDTAVKLLVLGEFTDDFTKAEQDTLLKYFPEVNRPYHCKTIDKP